MYKDVTKSMDSKVVRGIVAGMASVLAYAITQWLLPFVFFALPIPAIIFLDTLSEATGNSLSCNWLAEAVTGLLFFVFGVISYLPFSRTIWRVLLWIVVVVAWGFVGLLVAFFAMAGI